MKQTVLIVDDFASVRLYHTSFLTRKGYQCLGASGGEEALALLASQHVDLVLLDMMMPEMDGATFVARLDTMPGLNRLPVLIITSEIHLAQAALQSSSRPFGVLGKPVMPGELLQRVQQLLALNPSAVASPAENGS